MSRRKAKGSPRPPKARSRKRPAPSPKTGLYFPTDVAPETVFREIGRLRKEAEIEIERLIDLLDRTERLDRVAETCGYYDDREPDVDSEPSLGWTTGWDGVGSRLMGDSDLEADYADEEPSLGWCEAFTSGEGGCHAGPAHELEISAPAVTAVARERYLASKIDGGSAGVIVEHSPTRI
jgi:hypothetical protein